LGIGPGEAVALLLRNDICFVEATQAAQRLGAYAVPINWHFKAEEVAYILRDCGAKVLIAHADLLAELGDAIPAEMHLLVAATPPEIAATYGIAAEVCRPCAGARIWEDWIAAQDPGAAPAPRRGDSMIYTSGTTGRPKGVRRAPATPAEIAAGDVVRRLVYSFRPGMRTVTCCPLYHSAPNLYTARSLAYADLILLQPRFDPEALLQAIAAERISHLFLTPTNFVRLLKLPEDRRRRYDVSSLEAVIHAGAPCPPAVKRAMIEWFGPIINEFYGSTESGPVTFCGSEEWLARPGTVGRAVPGATIRAYSDDGVVCNPGDPGELFMRLASYPDFVYHGQPAARREIERDGLITSGDIGYFDAEGYLFICDRKRDMVISGGVNIYPAEIESVLVTMPGVSDGVVFGIPDEEFGESLMALVEPMPDSIVEPEAVRDFLRCHLADYKVPRRVELRETLPREDTGKIFKRKLRAPYWTATGRAV